jgi:hypothetical protein
MNIALVLLVVGIMMIVAGYTNQITPQCNKDIQIKIVSREIYDDILYNQELVDSVYTDMM